MRWLLGLAGLGIIFMLMGIAAGMSGPVEYTYRYEVQSAENFRTTLPPEHTYSYQNLSNDERRVFETALEEGEVRRDHTVNGSHFTHVGGDEIGPGVGLTGVVYTNQTYVVTGWVESSTQTPLSALVVIALGLGMVALAVLAGGYSVLSALVASGRTR